MESPEVITFSDDFDSACSTPFVSAPSSPGRTIHPTGFFYSAPASPIHFMISSSSSKSKGFVTSPEPSRPFKFEFTKKQTDQTETLFTSGSMTDLGLDFADFGDWFGSGKRCSVSGVFGTVAIVLLSTLWWCLDLEM